MFSEDPLSDLQDHIGHELYTAVDPLSDLQDHIGNELHTAVVTQAQFEIRVAEEDFVAHIGPGHFFPQHADAAAEKLHIALSESNTAWKLAFALGKWLEECGRTRNERLGEAWKRRVRGVARGERASNKLAAVYLLVALTRHVWGEQAAGPFLIPEPDEAIVLGGEEEDSEEEGMDVDGGDQGDEDGGAASVVIGRRVLEFRQLCMGSNSDEAKLWTAAYSRKLTSATYTSAHKFLKKVVKGGCGLNVVKEKKRSKASKIDLVDFKYKIFS